MPITRRRFLGAVAASSLIPLGVRSARRPTASLWVSTIDRTKRMSGPSEVPTAIDPRATETRGGATAIAIDPSRTGQTMLGLGSSLEPATCWNLAQLEATARVRAVERLVSPSAGIGMNLMRICIGTPDFTGDPWYSYDDVAQGQRDAELEHFSIERDRAYILPTLRLARDQNPDLLFFASPWSPPAWMKVGETLTGGSLRPEWYGVYARYFVRFVEAYAAEGVPVHAVTVQNEPGVDRAKEKAPRWHYPSCHWTAEQERDFIRDHLGPAFRRAGLPTKIWCYDHNYNETARGDDPGLAYPRTILRDPAAARFVDGVAFHGYAGHPTGMSTFHREFPHVPLHFTEGSVFGLRGGLELIDRLRNHASSYNAWVTMLDTSGKPNNGPFPAGRTLVTLDRARRTVTEHFDYDLYGHFMKFIARGAVRIDSSEGSGEVANVAFRNPDGTMVVVVVNAGGSTRAAMIRCASLAADISVPAASVTTLTWTID